MIYCINALCLIYLNSLYAKLEYFVNNIDIIDLIIKPNIILLLLILCIPIILLLLRSCGLCVYHKKINK